MSKIKTPLTNGTIGHFRNGLFFATMLTPEGKFLVTNDSDQVPFEEYDPLTLKHGYNDQYDVMELRRGSLETTLSLITSGIGEEDYSDLDVIWDSRKTGKIASAAAAVENKSLPQTGNRQMTMKTSVWIEINGKPVDVNNLSEEEKRILTSVGIIS